MEHRDVVRRRRMVRRYRADPVDPAAVERILDATLSGPSAGYAQGISLIAVTGLEARRRIADLAGERAWIAKGYAPWLSAAPVHIVICVEPQTYRDRYDEPDKDPAALAIPWWWVDGGAAMLLAVQAAVDEGLSAGFLGGHALGGVAALLGVPEDVEILGLVTIGHALEGDAPSSASRGQRPSSETIHREGWMEA
jgi:nitroreductase